MQVCRCVAASIPLGQRSAYVSVWLCVGVQGDEPAPEDEEEYEADEAEDDSEGSDEGESDGGDEVRALCAGMQLAPDGVMLLVGQWPACTLNLSLIHALRSSALRHWRPHGCQLCAACCLTSSSLPVCVGFAAAAHAGGWPLWPEAEARRWR